MTSEAYVLPFDQLRMHDVGRVGGKNASLGEMISQLVAPRRARAGRLRDHGRRLPRIPGAERVGREDRCAHQDARTSMTSSALSQAGAAIRALDHRCAVSGAPWSTRSAKPMPSWRTAASRIARSRCARRRPRRTCPMRRSPDSRRHFSTSRASTTCSQRSSTSSRRCTTTARSPIACTKASAMPSVALSAGVQRMVRSDLAASGVMFTLDTESGFDQVVFITASYGLGETVVQGAVNPDEFYVYKPALNAGRPAILRRGLGSQGDQDGVYGRRARPGARCRRWMCPRPSAGDFRSPMPRSRSSRATRSSSRSTTAARWTSSGARDGADGKLYILQARPETVKANAKRRYAAALSPEGALRGARDRTRDRQRIGSGRVRLVIDAQRDGARAAPATCSSPT